MIYIICILIVILPISGILIGMYLEYKDFNNGICPECGKQLKYFDTDSQGGRGYCCNDCQYYTWISYHWIEKKYKKNMEEQLIKYILELVGDDDCICTELHDNPNECEYCSNNCHNLNENCVRRLMYNRMNNL